MDNRLRKYLELEDEFYNELMKDINKQQNKYYDDLTGEIEKDIYDFEYENLKNQENNLIELQKKENEKKIKEIILILLVYFYFLKRNKLSDFSNVFRESGTGFVLANNITKFNGLIFSIQNSVDKHFEKIITMINNAKKRRLLEIDLLNSFNIQKQIGILNFYKQIDEETINKILKLKFLDKTTEERLWNVRNVLIKKVEDILAKGLRENIPINQIVTSINDVLKTSSSYVNRIIRTEINFVTNNILIKLYNNNNIEQFKFVAIIDNRTSEICRSLNNKIFNVVDSEVGVNTPPMHPNCRSVIFPIIDISKINIDGGYKVDSNFDIDFDTWKKVFVDNDKTELNKLVNSNKINILK